jgi:hypothetical protein
MFPAGSLNHACLGPGVAMPFSFALSGPSSYSSNLTPASWSRSTAASMSSTGKFRIVLRGLVRLLLVDEHGVAVAGLEREQAASDLDYLEDAERVRAEVLRLAQVVDSEAGIEG